MILNALPQQGDLTAAKAAQQIQKPEAQAFVVLRRLVDAGLVEMHTLRNGVMWRLSVSAHRALGGKAQFGRLEQEQSIVQFVEKHGRITRGAAAELCGLSPDQAYRVLMRLVEEGSLVRRGAKKGASYERRG